MSQSPENARAAALSEALETEPPTAVIAAACDAFPKRLAVVSSFGADSAVLLQAVAEVDPTLPVFFLDTGLHFAQTLQYRDHLAKHFGLRDVRTIFPDEIERGAVDPEDRLWRTDTDACCDLRKVRPLARALASFDAWISGRKRFQGSTRSGLPIVEWDGSHFKFNPLAARSSQELAARFENDGLPFHPLRDQGYASIGCWPCTAPVREGEEVRAGRWRGSEKTECGIHSPLRSESAA